MIERVIIDGYRLFDRLDLEPNPGMNIIVGDNESGKSTMLEALSLALTGRVNGRWAREELNPFWFNRARVANYFARYGKPDSLAPPVVLIELYLDNGIDDLQPLRGIHNSRRCDCPGIRLRIGPSDEYATEFKAYMDAGAPAVLPVEFYEVDWRDFSDRSLSQRPKALATSFIDSRTIRSTSGVDHHTKEMLSEYLDPKERAKISLAHRRSKQQITDDALAGVNGRIAVANRELHDRPIGLQMDQSSRTSWETGVVPQVDDVPFAMSGQGQQAAVKVALAMNRTASTFVLIEEPENHLSHTNLSKLVARIDALAAEEQQLFVTTHSSFVLNRLGLDKLILLHQSRPTRMASLSDDTVRYFRRLAGYDTLRLVLAHKVALVEGPSDAIVLERAFRDTTGGMPSSAAGIDIVSLGGLTFARALELCARLDREAVALQDNDLRAPAEVRSPVAQFLSAGRRDVFVSDPTKGRTLEPQLLHVNGERRLRQILGLADSVDVTKWMSRNKTEAALRIFDAEERLTYPDYILQAVAFLR
jgi:putative ATP-dependent endonuclease of OLD family